jgi:TPR repeat protein
MLRRAVVLYEERCERTSGVACSNLADLYERQWVGRPEAERAAELRLKACLGSAPETCVELAQRYLGDGASNADRDGGGRLMRRACDAGSPVGCYYLAQLLDAGEGAAPEEVRSLLSAACGKGFAPACSRLAEIPKDK